MISTPGRNAREAEVVLPEELAAILIPGRPLEVPDQVDTLPDPHDEYGYRLHSRRSHLRAHHRLLVYPSRDITYRRLRVQIPMVERIFDPFRTHWSQDHIGRIEITRHFKPDKKLDRAMHTRQRDIKHRDRATRDHSRFGDLGLVSHRNKQFSPGMYGALKSGDPRLVADSAIALWNALGKP